MKFKTGLPPQLDPSTMPFRPPDPDEAYAALERFYKSRGGQCSAALRSETGLPAYLWGNLQDPVGDGQPGDAAEAFLRQNELMLAGLSIRRNRTRVRHWRDGTYQVTFAQSNGRGVPLYGSNVVCNFRADQLSLVTSTLYPALPNDIDDLRWEETWRGAKLVALEAVIDMGDLPGYEIRPVRFEAPLDLREESRRRGLLVDRWILPYYHPPDTETGTYRPVWRVVVVDQHGERWLVLVDGETGGALIVEPTSAGATVQAEVFPTPQDALNDQPIIHDLDYGAGRATMSEALHAHVCGPRFREPTDQNEPLALRRLSANAFYHTRQVQGQFESLLSGSFGPPGLPTENPAMGLTKTVSSVVDNGQGAFTVTYSLTVENLGNVQLDSIQVTDDLSTTFAGGTTITVNSISSVGFSVNNSYDGSSQINLLTGTDSLDVGATGTITVIVTVTPAADCPYKNHATASGAHGSITVTGPDPMQDINVTLEDAAGSAKYDFSTRTIHMFTGTGGQWPINEPGFDCEVIYHEFTHAIARYLNPDAFRFSSALDKIRTLAIDEALAFYFGCTFTDNARWADHAYRAWAPDRDLDAPSKRLSEARSTDDPTGRLVYAQGMCWARLFWALRAAGQLGADECNRLLLKALMSLAGPQPGVGSMSRDEVFAAALVSLAANDNDRDKIRVILSQFGVDVP